MPINKNIVILISIIVLLSSVMLYNSANNSYENSNDRVIKHQTKSILLFGMHKAARERLLILYKMSLATDPFHLDDLNSELSEQASIFINYRLQYQALPLSNAETDLLREQIEATKIGAQYMQNISDLLMNNQPRRAYQLLTTKAEPAQADVLQLINKQIKIHKKQLVVFIKKNI